MIFRCSDQGCGYFGEGPRLPEFCPRCGKRMLAVAEDAFGAGCVGQRVAAVMAQLGMAPRRLVLKNTGDRFIPQGSVAELRHLCGLDAEGVAAAAEEAVHEQ